MQILGECGHCGFTENMAILAQRIGLNPPAHWTPGSLGKSDRAKARPTTIAVETPKRVETRPRYDLTETDRRFLKRLVTLRAFDKPSNAKSSAVIKDPKDFIGQRTSGHVTKCIGKLKGLELIKSGPGPNGGYWLTPKGKTLASDELS